MSGKFVVGFVNVVKGMKEFLLNPFLAFKNEYRRSKGNPHFGNET